MAFSAKVVLDSVSKQGKRVITVEATYPRFIHSEIMTHRDRERNAASSRAIPWASYRVCRNDEDPLHWLGKKVSGDLDVLSEKCMKGMLLRDPVVPLTFGREQRGMQQGEILEGAYDRNARAIWMQARDHAIEAAQQLANLGVHKSICNRITEPWMWITVVMTATEWNNFFRLRCHPAAEQHFFKIACMIRDAIKESTPQTLESGDWHLPYIPADEVRHIRNMSGDYEKAKQISTARCARVSYLTHDGRRDHSEDLKLYNTLLKPPGDPDEDIMHASPFGHVCTPSEDPNRRSGPFVGWIQYRKEFPNENVPGCL